MNEAHDQLGEQTAQCFGCLHDLIQAVEKESGKLAKVVATVTSLLAMTIARLASAPGL